MKRRNRCSKTKPPRRGWLATLLCATLVVAGCATPQPLVRQQWHQQPPQRVGIVPIYYAVETNASTPQAAAAFQERVAATHAELAHVVTALLRGKSFALMNAPLIYQGVLQRGILSEQQRAQLTYAINSLVDANRFVADRLYGGLGPPLEVTMGASVQDLPRALDVTPDAWLWIIITGGKESGTSYGARMAKQSFWAVVTLVATLGLFMLVPNPQRGRHFIASALVVEPQTGDVLWWNRLESSGDPLDVDGDVRGVLAKVLKEL